MMKNVFYLVFTLYILFGCKKSNNCPSIGTTTVSANNTTVIQGWDLKLSSNYFSLYTYNWSGPNGWNIQKGQTSVTRENMQLQDAGEYKVKVYDLNNCQFQEGKINIQVITPPHAPCEQAIANNSMISDLPGIGSFDYTSTSSYLQYPSNFMIRASGSNAGINPLIQLKFKGLMKPKPGVYKTTPFNLYEPGEGEVDMLVYDGVSSFSYKPVSGQDVYITLVNGKTQICCCDLIFVNNTASTRMTTKFAIN